jgi:sterol 3beta-glucosyltransferase
LFTRAKGVVHHGGVGTMAAALMAGVPQQIIPFSVDQPFWADRLYKLGYGLKPLKEKTLSSDDLVNAFIQMSTREVQSKAKQIGIEIQAENGNKKLVEYLEELI